MPDRENVIYQLEKTAEFLQKYGFGGFEAIRCAVTLLKEQEVKTGHWVSVNDGDVVAIDNDGFPQRACFCSECKKYLVASDEYAVYGRYCPFCGAKMEGR